MVRCNKIQLALNPNETFLGVQKVVLLGYVMNEEWREPNSNNIAVIDKLPTFTNA